MTPGLTAGTVFEAACASLEATLAGPSRRVTVETIARAQPFGEALVQLRDRLRSDGWIRELDRRTRADGFHVLNDWDGKADAVNPDIIPIDVLNYVAAQRGGDPTDISSIAVLLDYYYFHLLALLSVRLWDEGDANARLDRLQVLLDLLHGPDGSAQRFVADAETLILIATSHYERVERGYELLLDRVRTLTPAHQVRIAVGHASSMGSHLRFGFEATYARDTLIMRRDNVADYPWLCFALATLVREYARLRAAGADDDGVGQDAIVEALLNGLSPDARAFVGEPSDLLAACDAERSAFLELFLAHRPQLLAAFEAYRPKPDAYSPLSFFFNFAHNIVKGTVVDVLLRRRTWTPTFNDLLTARPAVSSSDERIELATTLMGYARANPDRIRGEPTPVIVYDPRAGHAAFTVTMRKLQE